MHSIIGNDETLDVLCGDRLKLLQKQDGYRFSVDAFLLANFITLKSGERLLDIGTGCGIIPIYMAKSGYSNAMTGIEIQEELFSLAMKNKSLNDANDQIEFVYGNIKDYVEEAGQRPFHVVVSNPPYTKKNTGRECPDRGRYIARHESHLDLSTLAWAASRSLDKKGRFFVIYPTRRLGELVNVACQNRLELKRLRMVHPRRNEKANLFLAEFMKEGGEGVTVEKPLYVYDGRSMSAEVQKYYIIEG